MARIRSIKPETWTSEQVMDLSRDARLLFIGMWNFCDDAGIHPGSPKRLKAEVFPGDDITSADVRRLIDEAIAVGLVDEYEVDGESFWIVTGWHHQKIDQPTFKHPSPDGKVPDGAAKRRASRVKPSDSSNTPQLFDDGSPNTPRTFDECSPPEGRGEEGNGEDRKGVNLKTIAASTDASGPPTARPAELSAAMRRNSIEAQPGDPRIIAAAEAGVSVATVEAACAEAKASDPTGRIKPGFVLAIAERWTADSQKPRPNARASPSRNYHDDRADTIAGLTGRSRSNESDERTIDVLATRID